MAEREVYIGSVGPFLYDDGDTYDGSIPHAGIYTTGRLRVDTAPSADEDVLRKADVGTVYAPHNAQYVVVALDGTLTNERRLQAGSGISLTDGGAGGDITLDVDNPISQQSAEADLNQTITDPPTQSEVQDISDKVDAILAKLRSAGVIAT